MRWRIIVVKDPMDPIVQTGPDGYEVVSLVSYSGKKHSMYSGLDDDHDNLIESRAVAGRRSPEASQAEAPRISGSQLSGL